MNKCDSCGRDLFEGLSPLREKVMTCLNPECELSIFKKGKSANVKKPEDKFKEEHLGNFTAVRKLV